MRARPRSRARAAPLLAVVAVLALPGGVRADDHAVTIAVRDAGFDPPEVRAPSGSRVRLEVANETGSPVEFESFQLNRERVIKPGQRASLYLSDLAPGRYEFLDDFHRERRGVLLVE